MTGWRRVIGLLLLAASLFATSLFTQSDFVQDYVAAHGWLMGMDPNSRSADLLAVCCANDANALGSGILQTAHPPLATLLTLPFALLPWRLARVVWLVLSWAGLVWSWERQGISPWTCAATSGLWLVALSLGSFEALLFVLIMIAIDCQERSPVLAGACIGIGAAIKIYPAVLLLGLWASGQRRAALAGAAAGALGTIAAELALGIGTTANWLAYTQLNAQLQAALPRNISMAWLAHTAMPFLPLAAVGMLFWVLFTLPLIRLLRHGDGLRPMLPVMLIGSPICWDQYFGLLALNQPTRLEQLCLGLSSIVVALVWLGLIPGDSLAPLGYGPLLVVLLLMWFRQVRHQGEDQATAPAAPGTAVT